MTTRKTEVPKEVTEVTKDGLMFKPTTEPTKANLIEILPGCEHMLTNGVSGRGLGWTAWANSCNLLKTVIVECITMDMTFDDTTHNGEYRNRSFLELLKCKANNLSGDANGHHELDGIKFIMDRAENKLGHLTHYTVLKALVDTTYSLIGYAGGVESVIKRHKQSSK